MSRVKTTKDFTCMPAPRGWVKFEDGKFHQIVITSKGVYFDGVCIAKGKLRLSAKGETNE